MDPVLPAISKGFGYGRPSPLNMEYGIRRGGGVIRSARGQRHKSKQC